MTGHSKRANFQHCRNAKDGERGKIFTKVICEITIVDALKYGAPPHDGIAFGIDRIAALMAGTESIRDVIAFPKTASAQDLMISAPSAVPEAQLQELHVRVVKPVKG